MASPQWRNFNYRPRKHRNAEGGESSGSKINKREIYCFQMRFLASQNAIKYRKLLLIEAPGFY